VDEFGDYALMDLRPMNDTYYLHLGGCPNHRGTHGPALINLFVAIGKLAPGSYGLMYVYDDEDPVHTEGFRIFRLVRGTVTEHADSLLSPVVPTLEDEYTA
jgi:hypothetical protein